jgi:hypothetical protein
MLQCGHEDTSSELQEGEVIIACTRLPSYADLLEAELVAEEVLAVALHWITNYNILESNSAKVIKLIDVKSPNLSHYVRRDWRLFVSTLAKGR